MIVVLSLMSCKGWMMFGLFVLGVVFDKYLSVGDWFLLLRNLFFMLWKRECGWVVDEMYIVVLGFW